MTPWIGWFAMLLLAGSLLTQVVVLLDLREARRKLDELEGQE